MTNKRKFGSPSLTNQTTVGIIVVIRRRADFLLSSEPVRAVLVGRRYATLDCFCKLSAAPSEGVGAAVVVKILGGKHHPEGRCLNHITINDIPNIIGVMSLYNLKLIH